MYENQSGSQPQVVHISSPQSSHPNYGTHEAYLEQEREKARQWALANPVPMSSPYQHVQSEPQLAQMQPVQTAQVVDNLEMLLQGSAQCRPVYEDAEIAACMDANPVAPFHVIVFPKNRFSLTDTSDVHQTLLGKMLLLAKKIAVDAGLCGPGGGYRIVINEGPTGHQTQPRLVIHVIGGRSMTWPPG